MLIRRDILIGIGGAAIGATLLPQLANGLKRKDMHGAALDSEFKRIEQECGGRLGIAIHDLHNGYRFSRRGGERFPMCSTFKFLLAGAILARVDQGKEQLDRRIPIAQSDMVDHAPVTEKHIGPQGMTVGKLCAATVTQSDNPAANLLLHAIGGIAIYNRFVRVLGDKMTRLDRPEPAINESAPGDPRDTTTPDAMLGNMERLLTGRALSPGSRTILIEWLIANQTGDTRLRAGLPKDWRVGDKTGAGMNGSNNDIAIIWPPNRQPLLVTSYLTQSAAPDAVRYGAHAAVARVIAAELIR